MLLADLKKIASESIVTKQSLKCNFYYTFTTNKLIVGMYNDSFMYTLN